MEKEPLRQPANISLSEAQRIQRMWEGVILGETTTPADRLTRWWDEAQELLETAEGKSQEEFNQMTAENPEFAKEVGMEAVDNIIILLSLIDHLGFSVENLFTEKIGINFKKYSIKRMNELVEMGFTRKEAMAVLKKEWNGLFNF